MPHLRVALYMNLGGSHQQGIARGIFEYAKQNPDWRLYGAFWTLDEVRNFHEWKGNGIIAELHDPDQAELLIKTGLPIVDLAETIDSPRLHKVINNNIMTGRMVGEHLAGNGYRHFAYCGMKDTRWSERRLEGFAAGIDLAPACIATLIRPEKWWNGQARPRDLQRFLRALAKPCAIMAANDVVGVKLTHACGVLGIKVPDEAAVVGVDDEYLLCHLSTPPLSSVPFNRVLVGMKAAELLDNLMNKRPVPDGPIIVPPGALTLRASSDIVTSDDPDIRRAREFIRDHAITLAGVDAVAKHMNMGRRNLERRFRRIVGRSILEEINRAKINHACRLLLQTDKHITKIAIASGFPTLNRFYALFRQYAGATPKEFRASRRIGD